MLRQDDPIFHCSRNGCLFQAQRDLAKPIVVTIPQRYSEGISSELASDIVEFAAWHALCIRETLNSFSGYDCLTYVFKIKG